MRWTLRERLFTSKRGRELQEAEAAWVKANRFPDDEYTRAAVASFKKLFGSSVVTEHGARSLVATYLYSQTSVRIMHGRPVSLVIREPERLGFQLSPILEPRFGNDTAPLILSLCRNAPSSGYRDEHILAAAIAVADLPTNVSADAIIAMLPKVPVPTLVDALTHGIPLEYAEAMSQGAAA